MFIDLILGALSGLLALLPQAAAAAAIAKTHVVARRYKMVPAPYGGFDKGSMRAANSGFEAAWTRLQATVGPTVK
jgi:hypothetical protein